MTGGVLMSKSSLLRVFILVFSGVFSFLPEGMAQDRIPACPPLGKTLKHIKPLLAIDDHYPKYVVSMDELWQDNIEGVKHRHIADFLLDEW